MTKKNLDYYVNLPYTYIIEWSDVDKCFWAASLNLNAI